jgi:hypothetical protein
LYSSQILHSSSTKYTLELKLRLRPAATWRVSGSRIRELLLHLIQEMLLNSWQGDAAM